MYWQAHAVENFNIRDLNTVNANCIHRGGYSTTWTIRDKTLENSNSSNSNSSLISFDST